MPPPELEGMRVLVTGAAGGIGAAIAAECAAAGARLFLADRDRRVEEGAASTGAAFELVDLAEKGAAARLAASAAAALGGLEGVIQAAGIQVPRRPLAELTDADWARVVAVNLTATVMVCRGAARVMSGGAIVNVGSVSGRVGMAGLTAYSTTKAAVHQLTRSLALELAPRVRVNAVAPGYVDTPLAAPVMGDAEKRRELEQRIPLGRVADPAEIAPTVRFLLGSESRYLTGQILTVDGGLLAH